MTLLTLHAVTTEASSAQMAVSWCVDEAEAATFVEELGYSEPRLLLVTRYLVNVKFDDYTMGEWRDSGYQVVKLRRGLAHVSFRRPGVNQVLAVLVDVGDDDSRKTLRSLVRRGARPGASVWDDDRGRLDREWWGTVDIRASGTFKASVNVNVDPELFAKPLSDWRKWVATRVFGGARFRDECQARKRTLVLGPLLLPFFVLGSWLARLASLVALPLAGWYQFPWSTFKRPFSSTNRDWFTGLLETRNFIYETRDDRRRHPLFAALSPHVLAALPAVTFGVFNLPVHYHNAKYRTHPWLDWGWWRTVYTVDGAYLTFVAVAVFSFLATGWAAGAVARWTDDRAATAKVDWDQLRREFELVACGDHTVEKVSDLSLRQLTPRLVYNAAKAKVCKPFAL